MTMLLDPRTTVSGVNELLYLREQIDALTARRIEVASHIAEDAEFMGGEVARLDYFHIDGEVETAPLGGLYHVARIEQECRGDGYAHLDAHPSDKCGRIVWCGQRLRVRVRARYTREPRRSWHTFLGTWVLVGYDNETKTGTLVAIQEATA